MNTNKIYCPFDNNGKIPNEVLQLIQKTLTNKVAIEHIGQCLKHIYSELNTRNVYACEYGNIEIWGLRTNSSSIYLKFKCKFINDELQHMSKTQLLTLFN
jgi:hypothetical protein